MTDYNLLLHDFGDTLESLSRDDCKIPVSYMTSCKKIVVGLDSLAHFIARQNNSNNSPKSCDALILYDTDKYFLIEFKNGHLIEDIDGPKIKEKILSSLLIILLN